MRNDAANLKALLKQIESKQLDSKQAFQLFKNGAAKTQPVVAPTPSDVLMFKPCWQEAAITAAVVMPTYEQHIVLLCEPDKADQAWYQQSAAELSDIEFITLDDTQHENTATAIEQRFSDYALQLFTHIQAILQAKATQPKGKTLLQVLTFPQQDQKQQALFSALSGLLKSAHLESPTFVGQLLEIAEHNGHNDRETMATIIKENAARPCDQHIKYTAGKRLLANVVELEDLSATSSPLMVWKDKGIYLITGGLGGLGQLFCKEIVQQAIDPVLIITGRSTLNDAKQAQLETLRHLGATISYQQLDVTQASAVSHLMMEIKQQFGGLNGILHSAGTIADNFIIKKTPSEFATTLAPKVAGLVNLDQASKDLSLDFLVLFSSAVGVMGNVGQADYATANSFMDAYATYRNGLVSDHQRQGKTLAINWPLWQEGGMSVDDTSKAIMQQHSGMMPMQTTTGIQAFYQSLASEHSQLMVFEGDAALLRATMTNTADKTETDSNVMTPDNHIHIAPHLLSEKTLRLLKLLFAKMTKVSLADMDDDEPFEGYGVDSIMVAQLNDHFETLFSDISKTVFYEYKTLRALSDYLITDYQQECIQWTGLDKLNKRTTPSLKIVCDTPPDEITQQNTPYKTKPPSTQLKNEPIAIIGISGHYPMAENLETYWQNLQAGKDCIAEIPPERWSMDDFYHADIDQAIAQGKSYSKWGGFLDEFADFDALFFNISPKEAADIDPQERLFTTTCWETLEDAGYTKQQLKQQFKGRVGVFGGITKTGFNLYQANKTSERTNPQTSFASLTNRVSYLLDINGPSMPVDTMCSSSLTAIHEACEHLQRNECEMALAGGVNLYLHPSSYVELCSARMLATGTACKSFGKGGNGFQPGEGVGAVLLKPLSKALADNDHIYAVIRGTGINHGGKTSGYTVPNPVAQGELIASVMKKAGVTAEEISYVEAHGTGTELGDPIEITGLTQAFNKASKQDTKMACAIGSVKSNIGHLEAAAGIAGVAKIVLQLQHKAIAPSLHSAELNPNIDFAKTPFTVQQQLGEWQRPVMDGTEKPRCASISSFGAGGANAHMIIEEYVAATENEHTAEKSIIDRNVDEPIIVVLSAKNSTRLHEYAVKLEQFISAKVMDEALNIDLADVAYTLQVGREAMAERLALVAHSAPELQQQLADFIAGKVNIENLYRGNIKQDKETLTLFKEDEEFGEIITKWLQRGKYAKLLSLWVKGLTIDWQILYADKENVAKPKRISVPTYSFAKERYWVAENLIQSPIHSQTLAGAQKLHPLLHENTSTLAQQRFSSTFTGEEFFLADHQVNGKRILPGVAYLEMARAALDKAVVSHEQPHISLKNIVWTQPIVVDDAPEQVHIALLPAQNGDINYQVYAEKDTAEPVIYSQGVAVLNEAKKATAPLDIATLKASCQQHIMQADECYAAFADAGLQYGAGHRGIEKIYIGEQQLLAKLVLPASVANTANQFILHPALMDAAFQTPIGLFINAGKTELGLPFALQRLDILSPCVPSMWAFVRYSQGSSATDKLIKVDMDLCDDQGKVCAKITGFTSRSPNNTQVTTTISNTATEGTLLIKPAWQEAIVRSPMTKPDYAHHIVVLCGTADEVQQALSLCNSDDNKRIEFISLATNADHNERERAEQFMAYALQLFTKIRSVLQRKPVSKTLLQLVIPMQVTQRLFNALLLLLETAQIENAKFIGQLLEIDNWDHIDTRLAENTHCTDVSHIKYTDNKRFVSTFKELGVLPVQPASIWQRDGAVYLITGGVGGLGGIFAKDIASHAKHPILILSDRGDIQLSAEKQALLRELESAGAQVVYKQADVTQQQDVEQLITETVAEFGCLNGIIHTAGIIRDNYIINKTDAEFNQVLAPKVLGLTHLDVASKDLELDFFIIFSSLAGIEGNFGQSDYGCANAFMDCYAEYRNSLVATQQRTGHTLSINWPLWKSGGMKTNEASEKLLLKASGMFAMQTEVGIAALHQAFALREHQVMVAEGQLMPMRQKLLGLQTEDVIVPQAVAEPDDVIMPEPTLVSESESAIDLVLLLNKIKNMLVQHVSQLLKVAPDDIDNEAELNEYGFDSISLTEFCNRLNDDYQLELFPTVFFEYPSIDLFAQHLMDDYQTQLAAKFGVKTIASVQAEVNHNPPTIEAKLEFEAEVETEIDDVLLLNKVRKMLTQHVSNLLKVAIEDIDNEAELNDYGFDSISLTEFCNRLNDDYQLELFPTVFFEYPTIDSFAQHLVEDYPSLLAAKFPVKQRRVTAESVPITSEDTAVQTNKQPTPQRFATSVSASAAPDTQHVAKASSTSNTTTTPEPIAIVGISGKFPKAEDLDAFWQNLADGRDCISEIPEDRWDWQAIYGDPVEENKTDIKWGGFIDGVTEFDSMFFEISPKEAEFMDPQQRLLMSYVWKSIEDAGHSAKSLAGTSTGIFVGTGGGEYSDLLSQADVPIEGYTTTGMMSSVGPNRMSYFLDIHGPSEPVETACSSSLVAMHRAVSAIQNGDCDMAITGGISTIYTPVLHISLNKGGMLSKDGRCKTFSDKANGYVRGEGVGMVFLKKLSDAKKDNNHIYGVIKATAENHGGRANSLTAPNPKAQVALLKKVYQKAGVDPRTINYIEAHGTGTELGDPIETQSLTKAFKELYQNSDNTLAAGTEIACGLGTVKSNIGHLELAAGIAGVLKVLLQMKHKTIAKSLHCDTINPYIKLDDSPFYIAQEKHEWKTLHDAAGNEIPRRAGVSSFGFGGVNAHVLIEEYEHHHVDTHVQTNEPVAFVLSAKTTERLHVYAAKMADFLRDNPDLNLLDVAYTAQLGRDAMEQRLAIIARSVTELQHKLQRFATGEDMSENTNEDVYRGNVKSNKEAIAVFATDIALQKTVETWLTSKNYAELLDLWVKGLVFDWHKLYPTLKPQRICLPTYPFETTCYWIPSHRSDPTQANTFSSSVPPTQTTTSAINVMNVIEPVKNMRKAMDKHEFTSKQEQFIKQLAKDYVKLTQQSREQNGQCHDVFSDARRLFHFSKLLKDFHYRLVYKEAKGAYLHDIDGNQYIDLSGELGVNLFGHQPEFIKQAMIESLNKGIIVSCSDELIGKTAHLFTELTQLDRVTFFQSGTESVVSAVRIARASTGKNKIVIFEESFHGLSDVVLAAKDEDGSSFVASPGIVDHYADDVIVLDYGQDDQLDIIVNRIDEIAGVLVEPIQSRHPYRQPIEFLKKLRKLTTEHNIPLIFDEMITGFRIHQQGVQGYYGIKADMATYGKIPGGGMPTGVLAGSAKYMDWIDGGTWSFDDDSTPKFSSIAMGGTHSQNSLKIAAMYAVLTELKAKGPALQQALNQKTEQMAQALNTFFADNKLPVQIVYFGSLFRFKFSDYYYCTTEALFFYILRMQGIETNIQGNCFLTTAHTEQHIDDVIAAVQKSMAILVEEGFFYEGEDIVEQEPEAEPVGAITLADVLVEETAKAESVVTETSNNELTQDDLMALMRQDLDQLIVEANKGDVA